MTSECKICHKKFNQQDIEYPICRDCYLEIKEEQPDIHEDAGDRD